MTHSSKKMIEILGYYYENYTDEHNMKYAELSNTSMFKRAGLIHLLEKYHIEYDLMNQEMIETKKRLERNKIKKANEIPSHFMEQFMNMSQQLNITHNCPCCFENISKFNITLPKCCHMICNDCYSKLPTKICPTCRIKI